MSKVNQTRKGQTLDWIEAQNRPLRWSEIHAFILELKGEPNDYEHRGYSTGIFDTLGNPTKKDPRYIEKGKDCRYTLKEFPA